MKLAEALLLRANAKRRLDQLKERLKNNAKVQEGDKPAEDPQELLAEIEKILEIFIDIVTQINITNSAVKMDDGRTITAALANRDGLALKWQVYKAVLDAAVVRQDRYSRSEVRFLNTFDAGALQKQADEVAREYRELDARIQQANWTVDLV